LETKPQNSGFTARLSRWNARHPILALAMVSLLAVVINCHPVIFCGRSFVSPANMVGAMVYSWPPLFPGLKSAPEISAHGSDVWATMVQQVPEGFVEYRDLLQQGELPLWDRYAHAGQPFLGQAITMLGDPLQLIVILGRGSATAWDLKFLTARFLFSAGFGWLVWRLMGSQPLGLLLAALGAYCGAFFYILIHPVFFVFAYAPWILLAAVKLLDVQARDYFRWGLVWLLVNFACFNAGFVEVAVILIAGLNLAALIHALLGCRPRAEWGIVLARMATGTGLFLGLTAPVWLSFFAALAGSYSVHEQIKVVQLPLKCAVGMFDEALYTAFYPNDIPALLPGTSFLVFAGCVLSIFYWRQTKQEPFFWVNLGACALWSGCIFGWVPAAILVRIPLLNRDEHTFTDFAYLLVIHLTLQAAFGFRALAREQSFQRACLNLFWAGMLMAGLVLEAWFSTPEPLPGEYLLGTGVAALTALLGFAQANRHRSGISLVAWTGIVLLGLLAQFRFGTYAWGDKYLLLLAGPRMAMDAASPAIEKIKTNDAGVYRVAGLQRNLLGEYAAVYGMEDIRSCKPLANGDYIDLVRKFPGIKFGEEWVIEITDPVAAQPLLNLLNVKYLLTKPGSAWSGGDFRMAGQSDFDVLENQEVWPRAFFTDRVIPVSTTSELIQLLRHDGRRPLVALAPSDFAQEPGLQPLTNTPLPVVTAATHYQLRANSTAFDVRARGAGIVCLLEGQARDFTATANGKPKTVITANRAFKAIYLDHAGAYHIEFTFRPRHWRLACGLFLTASGMLALLTIARVCMREGQGSRPEPGGSPEEN
jgi:hypothetical protein